ncbi:MAG: Wzz/FepE/Etk N-terminal domain-containing protein, partial [Pseudomonadota bacterium]
MTKFDYPAHTDPRLMDGQGRDDLISVSAIFKSLWRNAWIVALCTAIGIALAYHYAFNVAEQTYRATASVVLETGDQAFISFDETSGQLSGEVVSLNTQVGVLRGFDLLGRVVEELRLDEDPEFNPLLNIEGDQPAETSPERAQIGRELAVRLLRVQTDVRNLPNSLIFEIAVTTTDPVKSMNIA